MATAFSSFVCMHTESGDLDFGSEVLFRIDEWSIALHHIGSFVGPLVGLKRTRDLKWSPDLMLLTFMNTHLFQFCFADTEQSG